MGNNRQIAWVYDLLALFQWVFWRPYMNLPAVTPDQQLTELTPIHSLGKSVARWDLCPDCRSHTQWPLWTRICDFFMLVSFYWNLPGKLLVDKTIRLRVYNRLNQVKHGWRNWAKIQTLLRCLTSFVRQLNTALVKTLLYCPARDAIFPVTEYPAVRYCPTRDVICPVTEYPALIKTLRYALYVTSFVR